MQPATTPVPVRALDDVRELGAGELTQLDQLIESSLRTDVALVSDVSRYIVAAGGNRLRPLIVLLVARALGHSTESDSRQLQAAAIIEFIHTATLLHDDVVDGSALRRGRDTANAVFGNQASVLVGDFLYSRAFQMMVSIDDMRVMRILADATNTIAAGEVMQLMNVQEPDTTEDAYRQVVYRKTAKLFEAGAEIAGLIAGRGEDTLAAREGRGRWLARPIEAPGSRPLRFEAGGDLTGALKTVPKTQVIKCLCARHPDDPADLMDAQIAQLRHLFDATRAERLELLLEIVPPSESGPDHGPDQDDVARAIEIVYRAEIFPDWWKLPAPPANAWAKTWSGWKQVIQKHDKNCRGILLLGLAAPLFEVCDAISRARKEPLCRGFAVGRTIFADAVEAWAKGAIDDAEAKARMAGLYDRLIAAWA